MRSITSLLLLITLACETRSVMSRPASSGAEDATTTHTRIADAHPVSGNPNLLVSQVPAIDPQLRERVMQYLNSRAATLLDVGPKAREVLIATRFASTSQLHLVRQPMGARQQLTFGEEPITNAAFLPRQPNVLFYQQDTGGGEFHQIFRFDRRTGRSTMLTDGKSRHSMPVFSRDGKRAAYMSTSRNGRDSDVYVVELQDDITTFATATRATETTGTWFPVQFSPDGERLLVMQFRAIDDSDLHISNTRTGELVQVTPAEGRGSVSDAAWTADGKAVYVVTDRYSDFNELYLVDPAAPGDPKPLSRSIRWNVEGIEVAPNGEVVAVKVNEDGYGQIYLLNPETGKLEPVEVPPGLLGNMRFALDRQDVLTFTVDSARSPSDVWQLDVNSRQLTRWTQSEVGGLDTSSFVEPELVRYPSTDGITVPAFLYRPGGSGPHPVLVIWHGGPEGQSRPGFSPFIQMLVNDLGIAIMMPNVRGSDGYGKTYLALDNGVKRESSLKDIGATLDWIATQPDLDEERVGVYGGSYGGYMVLASMVFYPERIRCGIDVVGISSIPTFLNNTQDYRRDLRRAEYGDERDPEVRKVQERISPLNHVERIQGELFVQQGKNDPRVPQNEAEQIVEAVRANGQECWYLLALNEGHGFAKKENRDYALVMTVQFLRETLLKRQE